MTEDTEKEFKFEISLSVLNHLGRNLYRNFVTVLGEAISNSWDADAKNVWIDIDRENSTFSIKDDGNGMTNEDFQNKFLKIGYSKRKEGQRVSDGGRPYIGAKGIGKLALLSCADRVSVFTKTKGSDYVGGVIDNTDLDQAITDDLTPQQYPLERLDLALIEGLTDGHEQGTIVVFQNMKEQMKNSQAYIKKVLAMSFKFSLIDEDFTIHVNGDPVTIDDLSDLSSKTEFAWVINKHEDDFTRALTSLRADPNEVVTELPIKGFLATVVKPRDAKISQTDERASVDLFVNGRLREKNILRHIPTQRILESYLYGQIHYDGMDREGTDPFTSSREGIVEDDETFKDLLEYLQKTLIPRILDEWDDLRLQRGEEGDEENTKRLSKRARKTRDLYSVAMLEYAPEKGSAQKDAVEGWLEALRPDAEFNISAYVDCFLSENLVRQFIDNQSIAMTPPAQTEIDKWKRVEADNLTDANINFAITQGPGDLGYLGMDYLSFLAEGGKTDKTTGKPAPLHSASIAYKPIRNAVGHTSLLTGDAKQHLNLTFKNIKGRLQNLLKSVK